MDCRVVVSKDRNDSRPDFSRAKSWLFSVLARLESGLLGRLQRKIAYHNGIRFEPTLIVLNRNLQDSATISIKSYASAIGHHP